MAGGDVLAVALAVRRLERVELRGETRDDDDLPPPWGHAWKGRLDELTIDSQALTGNPLGDPHARPLYVYTPPGYDDEPSGGTHRSTCSRA